jgi:hypothetical protein
VAAKVAIVGRQHCLEGLLSHLLGLETGLGGLATSV